MQDNWTVDRDILHNRISELIIRKERFANSEFKDPLVIQIFCRHIYDVAKELVALHEKYDTTQIVYHD